MLSGAGDKMSRTATAMDRIVKLPFRVAPSTPFSKTAGVITVTELEIKPANLGARVAAIAPSFEYYRVTKLRLKCFSTVVGPVRNRDGGVTDVTIGVIGGVMGCSYVDSDTSRTGVITTLNELIAMPAADMGNCYESFYFDVAKSVLFATPVKWFDTGSTGTPPSGNQVQGLVSTLTLNLHTNDASGTDSAIVVVEGVIEFRGTISPGLSMAHRRPILSDQKVSDETSDGWEDAGAHKATVRRRECQATPQPPGGSTSSALSGNADRPLEDPQVFDPDPKFIISKPFLL